MKYNFDNYLRDVSTLYQNILKNGKTYDVIVGIQRGGLIPAVHLSNLLGIPMHTLQWSRYTERRDYNDSTLLDKSKNILLVDDIIDDGNTIHEVYEHYGKVDTAVLIYNCENKFNIVPDYAAWVINRSELPDWIDYWWEKEINDE